MASRSVAHLAVLPAGGVTVNGGDFGCRMQFDLVLGIKIVELAVSIIGSVVVFDQHRLGERRAVVGRMGFSADDDDFALFVEFADGLRGPDTGHAAPDQHIIVFSFQRILLPW